MLDGHIENGNIVLDESATLPEGAKVRIEVLPEGKNDNDPSCFHDLAPVRPLDAGVKESLRALLTQTQYDALVDLVSRGGVDVDAIRRLRAASMT